MSRGGGAGPRWGLRGPSFLRSGLTARPFYLRMAMSQDPIHESGEPSVFISYQSDDQDVARELALFFASEGIDPWYYEWKVSLGDSNTEKLNRGLSQCSHFILVWSHNSADQEGGWFHREAQSQINRAITTGNPQIIPVRLDDTPLPELIRDQNYHRYDGGTEEDRSALIREVLGEGPSETFVRAVVKKYHELVRSEGRSRPPTYDYCPKCGSSRLDSGGGSHPEHGSWGTIDCQDCAWSWKDLI